MTFWNIGRAAERNDALDDVPGAHAIGYVAADSGVIAADRSSSPGNSDGSQSARTATLTIVRPLQGPAFPARAAAQISTPPWCARSTTTPLAQKQDHNAAVKGRVEQAVVMSNGKREPKQAVQVWGTRWGGGGGGGPQLETPEARISSAPHQGAEHGASSGRPTPSGGWSL